MGGLVRCFLLLCDKELENEAASLATTLRATTGLITLKTLESVAEARGATIDKKLENILTVYADVVIIICSQNFANFIDKKDKSHCPTLLLQKYKDCASVLKKFMEAEAKKIPHKMVLLSLNGDTAVPEALLGMPILTNNENDDNAFTNHIMAQILSKIRR